MLNNQIQVKFIRRIYRHCFRFMDGYRMGMKGPVLDFAIKKYSKHRSFPSTVTVKAIEDAYKKEKEAKVSKFLKL